MSKVKMVQIIMAIALAPKKMIKEAKKWNVSRNMRVRVKDSESEEEMQHLHVTEVKKEEEGVVVEEEVIMVEDEVVMVQQEVVVVE